MHELFGSRQAHASQAEAEPAAAQAEGVVGVVHDATLLRRHCLVAANFGSAAAAAAWGASANGAAATAAVRSSTMSTGGGAAGAAAPLATMDVWLVGTLPDAASAPDEHAQVLLSRSRAADASSMHPMCMHADASSMRPRACMHTCTHLTRARVWHVQVLLKLLARRPRAQHQDRLSRPCATAARGAGRGLALVRRRAERPAAVCDDESGTGACRARARREWGPRGVRGTAHSIDAGTHARALVWNRTVCI